MPKQLLRCVSMPATTPTLMNKTYEELVRIPTFLERFEYLSLKARVGDATFGFERYLNQQFYTSREWRSLRDQILLRDDGCDLGVPGFEIAERPIIHHLVPMTIEDFDTGNPLMLDPNNLITTTHTTHNAIHYGSADRLSLPPVQRQPGDTTLWGRRSQNGR